MRRGAWIASFAVLALVVVGLALAAEAPIERRLKERLTDALAESEHVTGSIGRVDLCLPCLSYTVHDVRLESPNGGERAPLLEARSVDVGFAFRELHRCAACGDIVLHGARMQLDVDREDRGGKGAALDVEWEHIGRGLLPVPIDRIATEDAVFVIRDGRYDEPIVWRFEIADGLARGLSDRDRGKPPRVALRGATPGGGRFELSLDVKPTEADHSLLLGVVSGVPLVAMHSFIEQRMGVDVEQGQLSAKLDLEAVPGGWFGHVDCEIRDLDVFHARDLWERGPLQSLRDGVAGALSESRRDEDGTLRMRMQIDHRSPGGETSLWGTLGDVLRWMLLTPFTAPFGLDELSGQR